ncbi:hypothetical protein V8G54_023267 [Vigna mungo]|uniref:Uncharacterized protein n=1 Tax=Vigna mungo TaxID=3915 RepID=A0AAQ3RSD8_VIGMU
MEQKRETKKAKSKALNKKSDPNITTMKSKKPISDPKATLSQGFIQRDMPRQGFSYNYVSVTGIVSPPNRCKACKQKMLRSTGSRQSSSNGGNYQGSASSKLDIVKAIQQLQHQLDFLSRRMDNGDKAKGKGYVKQWLNRRYLTMASPASTWEHFKDILIQRSVPPHYLGNSCLSSNDLSKVDEVWRMLIHHTNTKENDHAKIVRFISGLNNNIQDIIEFHDDETLDAMVHRAMKVEKKLLQKEVCHNKISKSSRDVFYKFSSSKDKAKNVSRKPTNKSCPHSSSNHSSFPPKSPSRPSHIKEEEVVINDSTSSSPTHTYNSSSSSSKEKEKAMLHCLNKDIQDSQEERVKEERKEKEERTKEENERKAREENERREKKKNKRNLRVEHDPSSSQSSKNILVPTVGPMITEEIQTTKPFDVSSGDAEVDSSHANIDCNLASRVCCGAKGIVKSVVSGPTHVPELAQTEPEGATQEENSSRTRSVCPTNVGRADALHLFKVAIMEEPMPEKMPSTFDKYDRSGDPEEHLRSFMNAMVIYSPNDLVWCRLKVSPPKVFAHSRTVSLAQRSHDIAISSSDHVRSKHLRK